jgi:maltose alpha-D-glucosyltransferase/alpha-amylase
MLGPGDLWYKSAAVYAINVDTFQDSDGDGVGDFAGLTSRVDYLHALGVTCVWLLPFFPSPNRDNRYDVADYYGVDPRLGTLGDFVDFLRVARERGIRVMIDLVVNHTSDRHPWFLAARADRDSKYRDYYVWADEPPPNAREGMVFPGVEESTWSYDAMAGAWYFHRFYRFQPDLNLANPAVREEIRKIMGFWLELGVSGFRLDAAPFLIERKGVSAAIEEARRPHTFFRYMRQFLSWRRGDAAMLAEANVLPDEVDEYVGSGDKVQLLFNFYANQHLFLALATGCATPLVEALGRLPELPPSAQWANFLRNHDELDLGRLAAADRMACYGAFAPDEGMRLYERGVRRRLAPMLGNDRARLELAHALMLALPGTPVLRYGDEIGMGDDLSLPERESVRTPMQWTRGPNGGFSTAPAERLVRQMVVGEYGPEEVNVADQQRDPGSLLNWLQRALGVRHACPEIGWGSARPLAVDAPSVVALRCDWRSRHAAVVPTSVAVASAPDGGGAVVTLHNLAPHPCVVRLAPEDAGAGQAVELLADRDYGRAPDLHGDVALSAYGYRWFRIATSSATTPSP